MASTQNKILEKLRNADLTEKIHVPASSYCQYQEVFDEFKAQKFLSGFIPYIKGLRDKPSTKTVLTRLVKKLSLADKKWLFHKLRRQIEFAESQASVNNEDTINIPPNSCEHPYAVVYRKDNYEKCCHCGEVLCEG